MYVSENASNTKNLEEDDSKVKQVIFVCDTAEHTLKVQLYACENLCKFDL